MRVFDQYLREGETIPRTESFNGLSVKHLIHHVTDAEGHEGRTVLLEMEKYGYAVEAVKLVGDVTLRVRAVAGAGMTVPLAKEWRSF